MKQQKFQTGMYIVDESFKIVNINSTLAEVYPDVKVGDYCYEALALGKCQCDICPLKQDNVLFYNPIRKEWISANASEMEYPGHGKCYNVQFQLRQRISEAGNGRLQYENLDEHLLELSGGKADACAIGGYCDIGSPLFYANKELLSLLGYDTIEEFSCDIDGLVSNTIHPDDLERVTKDLTRCAMSGGNFESSYRMQKKDKSWFWIVCRGKRVEAQNGMHALLCVVSDMTEFLRRQSEMTKENELLLQRELTSQAVLAHMPGGYHRCANEPGWPFIYFGQSFEMITGWSREEIEKDFGNLFINMVLEEDIPLCAGIIEAIEKHGYSNAIYRIKKKGGGYIWVSDSTMRVTIGDETFFHGVLSDVSEQIEAMKQAKVEAEQLLYAVRATYEMIVSVNLTQNTYRLFGEDSYVTQGDDKVGVFDEVINAHREKVVDGQKDLYYNTFSRKALLKAHSEGKKSVYLEYQQCDENGTPHWLGTHTMFTENPHSSDVTEITISRNIDERIQKRTEEERLRREKEIEALQLTSVIKSAYDVVVSVNLTKRTYYVIGGVDYSNGEIPIAGNLDTLIRWVYEHTADDFKEDFLAFVDRSYVLNTHGNENYLRLEHKCIEADGEEHWVATNIMTGENPYSDDLLAIVTRRNIDERKNKDREQMKLLSDALTLAEKASRAKSEFLSRMSHDIRTPMNAVIGYATIAASHIDERERVKDSLKKILSSGEHLQGLINDVLDMSRIEAGKESLNEIRTSISEMVRTVLPMIQSQVAAKQLELYVDTIDMTDEFVYADAQKMRQLLLNILGNAVKFTSNGGKISVKIKQMPSHREGYATYTFLIKDTGIGMSKDFQKRLFDTFAQERSSTNSKQIGTGLGMAIAKSYVDMMGGTIAVESDVGKGTEFAVKVEFKLQEDVKPDIRLEQLHGYRALVVDDDFQSCDSIVHLLQDIGMRADFTTTAKEALFRTRMAYGDGDSYFAYIIDWIMPDMNGIELVRQIRKIIGDEVPIIILTAYYWGDIEEEAREAGVTAFCTKPLFVSDLTNIFLQHEAMPETVETFEDERILLVEDNDLNREIAKFMLEEIGFEVDIACDGQDAVSAMNEAEDGRYNYVLMDVQMPIMDGIEATKHIRLSDRAYLKEVPIIALTANAFTEDVEKCLSAGMNAHLAKPFKIEDIAETLNSFRKK